MGFTVEIASVPDRDSWVAEIWDGELMVAEISRKSNGSPVVSFYSPENSEIYEWDLHSLFQSLNEACEKLGIEV